MILTRHPAPTLTPAPAVPALERYAEVLMESNQPILLILPGSSGDPESPKIRCMVNVAESKQVEYILPDWRTEIIDPFYRLDLLKKTGVLERERVILAGSSLGGYVASLVAEERQIDGLFLLVPILGKTKNVSDLARPLASNIVIMNAWDDEEISPEIAFEYAQSIHAQFHLLSGNHTLENHLEFISEEFSRFLDISMAQQGGWPEKK